MKKKNLNCKILLIILSGIIGIALLFCSIKDNWDISFILRDIFYFPINVLTNNDNIKLDDKYLELQEEITDLSNLLEINKTLSSFTIVSSTVINRNASYWNNELTIDKGNKDKIKKGMAVIDGKGLIGKVEKVGLTTSIVKLINNNTSNNKISVKLWIDDKPINKVLEVDKDNHLIISGIDNKLNLQVGDKVTTSGLSDIYPSGIPIGTVEKVDNDKYGISKKAIIKTTGDLDNIRFVSVLIREE